MSEENKKKFIGQKKGKELFDEEIRLSKYEGEDRMVSSIELAVELDKTEDSNFIIPTGIKTLDTLHDGGIESGEVWIFSGPSGEGKSLYRGTKVLMYDGHYKQIQDVEVGDQLMGKDSTPRNVLSLGNGREEMFKVTPVRGESFVCNKSHILSVVQYQETKCKGKKSRTPHYTAINLSDYLKYSNNQKNNTLLYRTGVDWEDFPVLFDPYFMGLWLGDGNSQMTAIYSMDDEIEKYLHTFAYHQRLEVKKCHQPNNKSFRYVLKGLTKKSDNKLIKYMRSLDVVGNKHIPHSYKANSREKRLQLLAGLIDSDGYVNRTGYVFSNKNERLIDDVLFVARSLGFYAKKNFHITKGVMYWKAYISGDCSVIPVKIARKKVSPRKINKNILWTGIKSVESVGMGEYFGVTLDGDHEYLLKDFTVTHNTTMTMTITQNMAAHDIKTAWFTLEVTPRQFIKKMKARSNEIPLFYLPNENQDPVVEWLEERIVEAKVKYDCKVVFIDHLQQIFSMAVMQKNANLSWEIGDLMAKIKSIAVMHDIAICLIAHTKDDPSGSAREPKKEDIRDSGLVQRLADSIVMIWRVPNDDELKNSRRKPLNEEDIKAKVRVVKNRRTGKQGHFFMYHKDHYLEEPITSYGTSNNNW